LEDLSAINYRSQGVAEKIPETQETVLVKRIKHGVRSIKDHGWIGSKESNKSRGFSVRFARHKIRSKNYQKGQGPRCKPAEVFFLLWFEANDGSGGSGRRRFGQLAAQADGAGGRGAQGDQIDVLTGGGEERERSESGGVAATVGQPAGSMQGGAPAVSGRGRCGRGLGRAGARVVLTINSCIKVRLDLQADKSPVVVKGPFFPRVVNPRYRIRGTMCNARIQSNKAR
jgi:hypothetical protein